MPYDDIFGKEYARTVPIMGGLDAIAYLDSKTESEAGPQGKGRTEGLE